MATPILKKTNGFNGVIKLDVRDSVADWKPYIPTRAPAGAPNILFVLYDDTGLAAWSPFGGRINMPTLQRLADQVMRPGLSRTKRQGAAGQIDALLKLAFVAGDQRNVIERIGVARIIAQHLGIPVHG